MKTATNNFDKLTKGIRQWFWMSFFFFLAAYGYELVGNDFLAVWNNAAGICCWLFGVREIYKDYRVIKKAYEESKIK